MTFSISRTTDRSVPLGSRPSAPTKNASDTGDRYTLEINSMEDLLNLTKESDGEIVVYYKAGMPHVELYDNYRE